MDTDLTTEQFWQDLVAAYRLETPPAGAMCVIEFAALVGKSEKHARDILNSCVRAGKMKCGVFKKANGKKATYYWPM